MGVIMNEEYKEVLKEMNKLFPVMNVVIDIGDSSEQLMERELSNYYVEYVVGISNVTIKKIKKKG